MGGNRLKTHILLRYDLDIIVLPIPKKEVELILPISGVLLRDLADYSREFFSHYKKEKLGLFSEYLS